MQIKNAAAVVGGNDGGVTPQRFFSLFAIGEAITWALLLIGMFLKYVTETTELGVRIGGALHGFVFLSYVVVTVLVAVDQRWSVGRLALGVGSALIPYLTVPFEQWAHRRGLLGDSWRLREGPPHTLPERVAALALRRPVLAAVVAVVVVAVVFSVLLSLGPPTEWFA